MRDDRDGRAETTGVPPESPEVLSYAEPGAWSGRNRRLIVGDRSTAAVGVGVLVVSAAVVAWADRIGGGDAARLAAVMLGLPGICGGVMTAVGGAGMVRSAWRRRRLRSRQRR